MPEYLHIWSITMTQQHRVNNDSKGRDYPVYHASLKAEGEKNVRGDYEFEVNAELQKTLNNLFGKYVI